MSTRDAPYVFYAPKDHVHLGRRLLIDLIDGTLLGLLWIVTLNVLLATDSSPETNRNIFWSTVIASTFLYLVLLKRFARTLGYFLCDAKVVDLKGHRPSILALSLRALFIFIGPFNMLLDVVWLGGDAHHQAIRDKLTKTYAVRHSSTPAGLGHLRYVRVTLLWYNLLLPEVAKEGAPSAAADVRGQS